MQKIRNAGLFKYVWPFSGNQALKVKKIDTTWF